MPGRYVVLFLAALLPEVAQAAEFPFPSPDLVTRGDTSACPPSHSPAALAGANPPRAAACGGEPRVGTPAEATIAPLARLVWLDPSGVAFGTEAVVRPAVAELLREMGIATSWRRGDPHELARAGELRVIFLDRAARSEHGAPVLGATPSKFVAEPFVWVHVPSVQAAAGIDARRSGASLDIHAARSLGIGLARVIAHELVHALAPRLPHGKGLMSARLDRRMLTGARISVEPDVSLAVRLALLGAPAALPAGDTILAAETGATER